MGPKIGYKQTDTQTEKQIFTYRIDQFSEMYDLYFMKKYFNQVKFCYDRTKLAKKAKHVSVFSMTKNKLTMELSVKKWM